MKGSSHIDLNLILNIFLYFDKNKFQLTLVKCKMFETHRLTANFILFVTARHLNGPCMVCRHVPESASQTHNRLSRSAEITRRESIMTTSAVIGNV